MDDFAEAVQIVALGERRREFDELVLINENLPFRREESVIRLSALDGEGEGRVVRPGHNQGGVGLLIPSTARRPRDEHLRKEEPALVFRADETGPDIDMNTIIGLEVDRQRKVLNVVSIDVARRSSEVQFRREATLGLVDVGGLVARANSLGVDCFGIDDVGQDVPAQGGRSWNGKDGGGGNSLIRLPRCPRDG
jgi:hypothetical protein